MASIMTISQGPETIGIVHLIECDFCDRSERRDARVVHPAPATKVDCGLPEGWTATGDAVMCAACENGMEPGDDGP